MAQHYSLTRADSTIYFAKRAMDLSEKIHYPWGTFMGQKSIFYIYMTLGMYPKALELANQNKRLVDEVRNTTELKVEAIFEIGVVNFAMGQYDQAKQLFWDAIEVDKNIGTPTWNSVAPYAQLSALYLKQGKLDSAFLYAKQGNSMLVGINMWSTGWRSLAHCELGNVYFALGNVPMALRYYQDALNESIRYNAPYLSARAYRDYARLFFKSGQPDSCIRYANLALAICLKYNFGDYASDVCKVLVDLYQSKKMPDSALKYLQAMVAAKDTIFSQTRASQFLLIGFDEKQHQQEVEIAQTAYRNKVRILVLGGVLSIFILLAGILYRNNLQRKKTNKQNKKKKEGLEATLDKLNST
jgi:tetratricopeptide (TPR) repeat protein